MKSPQVTQDMMAAWADYETPPEAVNNADFILARDAFMSGWLASRQSPQPPQDAVERLKRIDEFVTNYFAPWGSWKTAWWEGEVSDDAAFSDNNALKHVANIARASLSGAGGEAASPLARPAHDIEEIIVSAIWEHLARRAKTRNTAFRLAREIRAAIAAITPSPAPPSVVECRHEPYQGRCVHCDIPFLHGQPYYGETPRDQALAAELIEFDKALYSAMRSQEEDVKVNGAEHPGLLEPMQEILQRLYRRFKHLRAIANGASPTPPETSI
jgi:hypothetical protein